MLTKNIVALQKNIVVAPNDYLDNRIAVSSVQAHLMQFGYMLSEDAFLALSKSDLSIISEFNNEAITYLKNVLGGKRNYTALYKNFPQEVMSLSDSQLFWNAIRHYWSNGTWEPTAPALEKEIKFEKIKYTILENGSEESFDKIFTNLVSINTSLTPTDLEVVKWFVTSNRKLVFPDKIPFKENLCTLAGMGLDIPVKTVTDVLRIAVHLSGGDISLPAVPNKMVKASAWTTMKVANIARDLFKFRKFKRAERKYILSLLEKTNFDEKEMVLKSERWLRLGEILHPGEYKDKFPKSYKAFNAIRNEKVISWYGLVEKAFDSSFENGLTILATRSGEYVRRLDALVRKNPKGLELIMKHFKEASKKASNKVLFEVYDHFTKRDEAVTDRSVFVKGARKKTELPALPAIDKKIINVINETIFDSLKEKFSQLTPLGNCWIDEELKKIPLPTNMRSMNFSTKPTVRGSRIPFDNPSAKVIRPFIHWMDKNAHEDLDLSVTFIGSKSKEVVSFHNLRNEYSTHSGDVRHRKGPCAEYVDIDIAKAIKKGFKYAAIDVRNFQGRGLDSVECMFGLMERKFPESNSSWLPETISNCQSLESPFSNTLAVILDLIAKEYIMVDLDSTGIPIASSNATQTEKLIESFIKLPAVSVYDLVLLHVEARGKQVTLVSHNVDTYFKYEDFITSYEKTGLLML